MQMCLLFGSCHPSTHSDTSLRSSVFPCLHLLFHHWRYVLFDEDDKQWFLIPFFLCHLLLSALFHSPSAMFPLHPVLSMVYPTPHPSQPRSSPPISSSANVFILAQQQVLECLLERGVAQRVTRRVDGGVDVTQPVANDPHSVGDARLAEGWDQHHDIVWRPCDDERQQDCEDGFGHLQRTERKRRVDQKERKSLEMVVSHAGTVHTGWFQYHCRLRGLNLTESVLLLQSWLSWKLWQHK